MATQYTRLSSVLWNEVLYKVGDCVLMGSDEEFCPPINSSRGKWKDPQSRVPWIAKIEDIWQKGEGDYGLTCQWFWFPKDTFVRTPRGFHPRELFASAPSSESDRNYFEAVIRKCTVLYIDEVENFDSWVEQEDCYFWKLVYEEPNLFYDPPSPIPPKRFQSKEECRILDVCSGCGGLSKGFEEVGFPISWAAEMNSSAAETFRAVHPQCQLWEEDIRVVLRNIQFLNGDSEEESPPEDYEIDNCMEKVSSLIHKSTRSVEDVLPSEEEDSSSEERFLVEQIVDKREQDGRTEFLVEWYGTKERTWEPSENLPPGLRQFQPPPEYPVETIEEFKNGLFRVRWEGWDGDDTWEPVDNLSQCPELLQSFIKTIPSGVIPKPGDVGLLMGGVPCQGFSSMNRTRGHYDDPLNEPRNGLVKTFLDYVKYFSPPYLLLENVPGIINMTEACVVRTIVRVLIQLNYQVRFGILNASGFGVPQNRNRFLLWGARRGWTLPTFPVPWHFCQFPKAILKSEFRSLFVEPPDDALPPITVLEAIGDLPPLQSHWNGTPDEYFRQPFSAYQALMRRRAGKNVTFHRALQSQRVEDFPRTLTTGLPATGSLTQVTALFPKDSQWRRPFRTVLCHGDSRHVQYFHPAEKRWFSVRELARAQSFPDDFPHRGPLTQVQIQIGNAVPPLLALALASAFAQSHGLPTQDPLQTLCWVDVPEKRNGESVKKRKRIKKVS